jgi:hypothetical protein
MSARPSIDDRMNRWLNDEADRAGIPDDQRQAFIDHMRKTTSAAAVRLGFAADDAWEDSGIPRWLIQLSGWLERHIDRRWWFR